MASNSLLPGDFGNPAAATARRVGPRPIKTIRAPSFAPGRLFSDLVELVRHRDLLFTLSLHRIKVRYKQSLLGITWAILQPLSLMLIYTFIFSVVTRMPSDGLPYALFTYTALLPWLYFSTALTNATTSLVAHSSLVTKVYFPRDILPLTYVIAALCDFFLASIVLAGLMLYYRAPLTIKVLYVLPIIIVLTTLAAAMSFLFSAVQVRFRDVGVAMPLLLQLWMFATPIIYPLSVVPKGLLTLYMLNPMVGVIESFRRVMLQGVGPDWLSLGVSALIACLLLPATYLYFKHVEANMADTI